VPDAPPVRPTGQRAGAAGRPTGRRAAGRTSTARPARRPAGGRLTASPESKRPSPGTAWPLLRPTFKPDGTLAGALYTVRWRRASALGLAVLTLLDVGAAVVLVLDRTRQYSGLPPMAAVTDSYVNSGSKCFSAAICTNSADLVGRVHNRSAGWWSCSM
jgi:hypothetical protein